MRRCLLILLSFFLYSSSVTALDLSFRVSGYPVRTCELDEPVVETRITADPVLANIGDVIGEISFSTNVLNCDSSASAPHGNVFFGLVIQPAYPGVTYNCRTTLGAISFDSRSGVVGSLQNCLNPGVPVGPGLVGFNTIGPFPHASRAVFSLIKRQAIPPGIHQISFVNPGVVGVLNVSGWTQSAPVDFTIPPGEIIGTECSLVTTNVVVDFGNVSDVGAIEPFEIGFDSCTDQADAMEFHDAIALSFRNEKVRADGTALQNGNCAMCATGVQVGLQDGVGAPINLNMPYALSSNPSVVIGPAALTYTFMAQLQNNPDEPRDGGAINTQMVFDIVVE